MPQISVIIPVFNTSAYLPRCVDSVLSQAYHDWELILVDDGSTDASADICDRYCASDTRIRVIHRPNSGVSASRNAGIDMARGRWLAFVDSDDSVDPDFLSTLIAAAPGCHMVAGGYREVGPECPKQQRFIPEVLDSAGFIDYFRYPNWGFVWGRLFDASLIRKHDIRFDPQITFREDNLFVQQVMTHAQRIALIEATGYHYSIGTTLTKTHIKTFEKELYALRQATVVASALARKLGSNEVFRHINLYGFVHHALLAVTHSHQDRALRLQMLRQVDFDPKMLFPESANLKTSLVTACVLRRWWRLYDYIINR